MLAYFGYSLTLEAEARQQDLYKSWLPPGKCFSKEKGKKFKSRCVSDEDQSRGTMRIRARRRSLCLQIIILIQGEPL